MPQQPLPKDTALPDKEIGKVWLNTMHVQNSNISLLTQPQMFFSQASYPSLH